MTVWFVMVIILSASGAVVGAGVVQKGFANHRRTQTVNRRLALLAPSSPGEGIQAMGGSDRLIRRLARLSLVISRDLQSHARLIRGAGMFGHGAIYGFLALRVVLPPVGGLLALTGSAIAGSSPVVTAALTLCLVLSGYFGPALVLRYRGRQRRKRIARELPLFLDSVKLLLQTGASLELTLRHISRMESAAIPEIRRTVSYFLEDLDQGKSYDVSFDRWVEKLAVPDAEEFAGLMRQSIRHGTELTPMLQQFIQDQIHRQLSVAREAAGKRSVWLTVIMVAFFLPPLMMVITAPAIVEIGRSILK